MKALFLTFLSFASLPAPAVALSHITIEKISGAIENVRHGEGRNFCQSDQACQIGMSMALLKAHTCLTRVGTGKPIAEPDLVVILKTAESCAKAACRNTYAIKDRLKQCQNGAQATISFIATELGINDAAPCLPPQIVQGQAYAGYERYNRCLKACARRTSFSPNACATRCKGAFDLKAFLNSLPQLK